MEIPDLSGKSVLITGGAGFIGSHLAERSLEAGARVCVIDDLSTGSIRNIAGFKDREGFAYHIDTVFNRPLMAELIDEADWIFHLAAAVGVRLIVERPVHTIETLIKGAELVFELAAVKGKRTLLASSSEVYGKSEKTPFHEEDDMVLGPTTKSRWCYACSKAIDEFLALAYFREKGLPVVIARFFNTLGPRQTGEYGMVAPRFVQAALRGGPLEVYDDGRQTRSFLHVDDAVSAVLLLMADDSAAGEIFNVGSDQGVTINELAERIVERCGGQAQIKHLPYDEAYSPGFEDIRYRVPSIERLRRQIGFEPRHSLDEIIDSVIAYHRDGDRAVTQ